MSDRTGRARGTLRPVIYFTNVRDPGFPVGYVILAPSEVGKDPVEFAHYAYESDGRGRSFRDRGWAWGETDGSLSAVDALQKKLISQEREKHEKAAERDEEFTAFVFQQTGEALRARMVSSDTTPFERDAIRYYLQMRDEKRDQHRHAIEHHGIYFIAARELDSSRKIDDLMSIPELYERKGV